MGKEGGRLLEEARRLLENLHGAPRSSKGVDPLHLEGMARRLLRRFRETADCAYFNAFYQLTNGMLHAYALRHTARTSVPIDPADIIHRLYILLFERLLAPDGRIPLDYLFPWCYRVVANLVRGEVRRGLRSRSLLRERPVEGEEPAAVNRVLEAEERTLNRERYRQVVETLYSERSGLSARDRIIMRRFYLEGRSLRAIGEELGLTKSHVGVILMRSRRRIARHLEASRIPGREGARSVTPSPRRRGRTGEGTAEGKG